MSALKNYQLNIILQVINLDSPIEKINNYNNYNKYLEYINIANTSLNNIKRNLK